METTGKMLKLLLIVIDGPKIFFFFFFVPLGIPKIGGQRPTVWLQQPILLVVAINNFFERFLPSTVMDEINQKPSFIPISQGLSS